MLKAQRQSSYAPQLGGAAVLNRVPGGNGALLKIEGRSANFSREAAPRCRNAVLSSLPADVWARLEPNMRRVLLHQRDVLQESGMPVKHAYFIESGMVSLVVDSHDGSQVEVGVTGREGIVGGLSMLGGGSSFQRAIVQIPGSAYRLPAEVLRDECRRSEALGAAVHEYSHLLFAQSAQAALCNRLHTVEERLSRWLLTARNRIHSSELELTHEFIAHMLGTRRSGVTVALGILQAGGMIDTTRGRITLLDDKKIESCACECYGIIQHQFESFQEKIAAQGF